MQKIIVMVVVGLIAGTAIPASAQPPGMMTVRDWREFLDQTERIYDERASRAIQIFHADGVLSEGRLWQDCLKSQTVLELRTWLRLEAPEEITMLDALRLNAQQHGCTPRAPADRDAEMATWK